MAGEQFHGKGGIVSFDAETLLELASWNLTYTADTAETTCLTATNKSYLPGFTDFIATVESFTLSAAEVYIGSMTMLSAVGLEASLSMTDGGGNVHTLPYAFCSAANIECDMNGAEKMVLTFVAAGDD